MVSRMGTGVVLALAGAALGAPAMASVDLGRGSDIMAVSAHSHTGNVVTVAARQDVAATNPARRAAADLLVRKRRSRGPQVKPRRKTNRQTVSRRVRRKHRRAA